MTEPASVVAARQLAEEARARRADGGCAPGTARPLRKQRPPLARRLRSALLVAGTLTTAGCGGGLGEVCPAIGYGSAVVVQLDDGWPAGVDRFVEFVCDPACPSPVVLQDVPPSGLPLPGASSGSASARTTTAPTTTPAPPTDPVVAVDPAGRAALGLYDQRPDVLTVRVLEADVAVAEVTADPEFVRVDGTEQCGGNTQAEVVVPAP